MRTQEHVKPIQANKPTDHHPHCLAAARPNSQLCSLQPLEQCAQQLRSCWNNAEFMGINAARCYSLLPVLHLLPDPYSMAETATATRICVYPLCVCRVHTAVRPANHTELHNKQYKPGAPI
jgi:hypothetical protein